jgi:hypothetical protein
LCIVEVELNCTAVFQGTPIECEEIPAEENFVCTCPDCVRELLFVYTGAPCNGLPTCTDTATNPFTAGIRITNAAVPTEVLISGEYNIGDTVAILPASGQSCIPDRLAVSILVPTTTVTQTFEIDSSCDGGRELILLENYASFESVGYSCDTSDTHNCFLDVLFEVEVCNLGFGEETIYDLDFVLNGTLEDLTVGVPPEDLVLLSNECYIATVDEVVERCAEREYVANATVNATNPLTGPTCEDEAELSFGFTTEPLAPTPLPRYAKKRFIRRSVSGRRCVASMYRFHNFHLALFPISTCSPMPSPAPSPAPTSGCDIDVTLNGCFNTTPQGDNNCNGRPIEMTFRYNGGDCSQSDNLQDRQNFDCFDVEPQDGGNGPPPIGAGVESLVTVTQLGVEDTVYFSGLVPVGGFFELNGDRVFDKLAADMNFSVYDPAIGQTFAGLQQTVFVHLSCSQPLFLKDRFGAHQVVQFIEDDGRNVSCFQETQTGNLVVSLNASTIDEPVELNEMVVISNIQDEPINYTSEVAGVILEPGGPGIELPPINVSVDLTDRVRYTFFTTVIGTAVNSGVTCNGFDFTECIAGVALPPFFPTLAPTPSPTITPFPTPDPNTTTCIIRGSIDCLVTTPFGLSCDTIKAPSSPRCTTGSEMELLVFQYTGAGLTSPPDQVWIEVTDCETTAFFQGTVNLGDNITINSRGNFLCDSIEIVIETVVLDLDIDDAENEGELLEEASYLVSCVAPEIDPISWTLNADYGALRLIQYNSDLDGIQSATATLFLNYAVTNIGAFNTIVESALLVSPFSTTNPSQIAPTPFELPKRVRLPISNQTATIDLLAASGTTLEFTLDVSATSATTAGLPCDDFQNYSIAL